MKILFIIFPFLRVSPQIEALNVSAQSHRFNLHPFHIRNVMSAKRINRDYYRRKRHADGVKLPIDRIFLGHMPP